MKKFRTTTKKGYSGGGDVDFNSNNELTDDPGGAGLPYSAAPSGPLKTVAAPGTPPNTNAIKKPFTFRGFLKDNAKYMATGALGGIAGAAMGGGGAGGILSPILSSVISAIMSGKDKKSKPMDEKLPTATKATGGKVKMATGGKVSKKVKAFGGTGNTKSMKKVATAAKTELPVTGPARMASGGKVSSSPKKIGAGRDKAGKYYC